MFIISLVNSKLIFILYGKNVIGIWNGGVGWSADIYKVGHVKFKLLDSLLVVPKV